MPLKIVYSLIFANCLTSCWFTSEHRTCHNVRWHSSHRLLSHIPQSELSGEKNQREFVKQVVPRDNLRNIWNRREIAKTFVDRDESPVASSLALRRQSLVHYPRDCLSAIVHRGNGRWRKASVSHGTSNFVSSVIRRCSWSQVHQPIVRHQSKHSSTVITNAPKQTDAIF